VDVQYVVIADNMAPWEIWNAFLQEETNAAFLVANLCRVKMSNSVSFAQLLELEATYNPDKKKKKALQTLSVDFGSFHSALTNLEPTPVTATTKSKAKSNAPAPAPATPTVDHQQFTIHSDSSKPLQSKKAKKKAA